MAQVRPAPDAETHSVRFKFQGPHELKPEDLEPQIGTRAPSSITALQSAFAWLPFVPEPAHHPFVPIVLQGDVVRLRRLYRRQGFLEASVDYATRLSNDRQRVDVTFLVHEGEPLRLRSISLEWTPPDSGPPLPEADRAEFARNWKKTQSTVLHERFDEAQINQLQAGLVRSLADKGFAFVTVTPKAAIDSVGHRVDLVWAVDPGSRSRISGIQVEGLKSVPEKTATRELGFSTGEWTSQARMQQGRVNLQTVDLFRSADVSLGPGTRADTLLPVQVRVSEDSPRFTGAEIGYITDGAGISGQTRWTHPNFTGGARSLSVIGLVQSGWGTSAEVQDQLARGTLALAQPFVGAPEWSVSVGPSLEWRNGRRERSTAVSGQVTFVRRFNALQSAALRYEYTYRKVDFSQSLDLGSTPSNITTVELGGKSLLDTLNAPIRSSVFSFSTSLGRLDDIARPRHGAVLKPNLSITLPRGAGNVEFGKIDVQLTAFAPLPGFRNALMFRGSLGRVWPFGQSIPSQGQNPGIEYVRMHDFLLVAGGASDVRGYGTRLLGPKVPKIDASIVNGDTVYTSDHYIETGGFERMTGTIESRLALPFVARDVYAHLFADVGRVWTDDSRLALSNVPSGEQRAFYTTGGGVGYYTAVGAIRFDVGYKLNPSVLDLRNPQDVVNALAAHLPPSAAPVDSRRRFGYHFALGLYF